MVNIEEIDVMVYLRIDKIDKIDKIERFAWIGELM
jgi:hypothetical protein